MREINQEIIICPPSKSNFLDFEELYRHRRLLLSMTNRKIRLEFGDLYFDFLWVIARPLLMCLLFVSFRNMSSAKTGVDIDYASYLYSGLILWFYFVESVMRTAGSIKADVGLIQKIYFPRLLSPLSDVLSQLFGLLISIIPLLVIMVWQSMAPDWKLILIPLVIGQVMLLSFGLGCIFSAISILSQDWERLLALLLYLGLFISPVIFAPAMLPADLQSFSMLNPMSGALLAFRATLFSDFPLPIFEWIYSFIFSVIIGVIGIFIFQYAEKTFLDKI